MLENYTFKRIYLESELQSFDCDDEDLRDFFHNDALDYTKELLTVTYTFEHDNKTIAFFSVLNDKIVNENTLGKRLSNALSRLIPNDKRRPTYPGVKVGRLGVSNNFRGQGIGSEILDFIKQFFVIKNKTGCRFITIDAYNKERVLSFYERNGFKPLTPTDKLEDTRLMYFDLKTFVR